MNNIEDKAPLSHWPSRFSHQVHPHGVENYGR